MSAALGIDVGGTKVALRLSSGFASTFAWPVDCSSEEDLALLGSHVRGLQPDAVGVAMPATMDGAGRVTAWPTRPSWVGLDLRAELTRMFAPATVRVADDGDLAAVAEADAAGCADVVYLGVGTGIGGGAVVGGRPCPGPSRGSCEVGHTLIDRAGPPCDCGRTGCLQAVASGVATLRRAGVPFDELRAGWIARSAWAVTAVEESCLALAAAAVSLGELFRPSLTIIGGGFAAGLPGFVDTVAAHTARLGRPGHPPAPVRAATLGGLSSLHGALLLAQAPD